jgi:hypothetical protein
VTSSGCLLSGYAWGGDIGWIKFRGTTQNGMEYGVSNSLCPDPPPMVSGLSASLNFCAPAPNVSFSWIYTDSMGENEKKFEFQVDNNSDFSSPEINRTLDNLDYVSPAANNQSVLLTSANESDKLTYNGGAFYWRVRVWDAEDNNTPHTNFSEPSLWVVASSVFNLPFHAYPDVHFVWAPLNPGINQETQFLDESRVFGGSSLAYRLWTFPLDSFITDKTTADLDPKIKFISCGNMPVSLRIDDSTGYSCTLNQTVVVKTAHCWQP